MSDKTKSQQAKSAKDAAILSKAETVDLGSSLDALTRTSLEINETLADVGKRLITKCSELEIVEGAIKLKKEELKELHGADKALLTISELEAEKVKIEEQNRQVRDDVERERGRETEQYEYLLLQQRKKDSDNWDEEVRIAKLKEKERQEAFDKDHKVRNEALAAKEKQYNEAVTKVATFDTEVAAKVKAEVGRENGILTTKFEAEKKLAEVVHKAEVDGLKKDIEHATKTIAAKDIELAGLREQLAKAIEAQTNLAKATVEGANDKKSLADMQSIVTTVGGSNGRPRAS